jgi:putative phosphoesterase
MDKQILSFCEGSDEIWHAGDIGSVKVTDELSKIAPVRGVYGNIDGTELRALFPLDQKFNIEEVSVWITHIGGYPGRYHPRVRKSIVEQRTKLFISGHSHILKVMPDKKLGLLHMNPGAIGKQGFHNVRTMLRFSITGKDIHDLEVVEIKR